MSQLALADKTPLFQSPHPNLWESMHPIPISLPMLKVAGFIYGVINTKKAFIVFVCTCWCPFTTSLAYISRVATYFSLQWYILVAVAAWGLGTGTATATATAVRQLRTPRQ
jgi:hypothetical protein